MSLWSTGQEEGSTIKRTIKSVVTTYDVAKRGKSLKTALDCPLTTNGVLRIDLYWNLLVVFGFQEVVGREAPDPQ